MKTVVVSSSKNCKAILDVAGINALFDLRIDGIVAEREKLKGKPHPDIFLRAVEELGTSSLQAAVFEDAEAGVEVGHAGKFGIVVSVSRNGNGAHLLEQGADLVVKNFRELKRNRISAQASKRSWQAVLLLCVKRWVIWVGKAIR